MPPGTPLVIGPGRLRQWTHEAEGDRGSVRPRQVGNSDDLNNFRLTKLVSKLYGILAPETRIPIYDLTTTLPVSWMVVKTPVAITPVTRAEIRSIQFVECRALMDLAASSSN